ncbi:MAG: MFS transporter [Desulfuromonadales bacterium]
MFYTLTMFVALFAATFILMLGSGLVGSLLSLRMGAEGFAAPLIGVIMAAFYAGLIFGSSLCPPIVRRVGHIRAFTAFAAINTAATLCYPLWTNAPVWFVLRILTGISMMGMYMVVESWLNKQTRPQMRGRVFSVYMSVTFLGLGLGQLFLNVREIDGSDLFLVVGVCFALCLVPMALTRSIHPELPESASMKFGRIVRRAPMGLVGSFVAGLIGGAFYSLAPVFAAQSGLQIDMVAYFISLTILCGLLLQWPVGILSDRVDRCRVLSTLSFLATIAALVIILAAGRSQWLLLLTAGIYGGVAFTLYPVAVAHTNDRIENHEIVAASTVLILCYGIGAFFGPLGASVAMALVGSSGLYLFIALATALLGVTLVVGRRMEKPMAENPVPYVPSPNTSPVIASIHPYGESEDEDDEDLSDGGQESVGG